MKYKILEDAYTGQLECKVNEMLQLGWELCGGLRVASAFNPDFGATSHVYIQVMTKNGASG